MVEKPARQDSRDIVMGAGLDNGSAAVSDSYGKKAESEKSEAVYGKIAGL